MWHSHLCHTWEPMDREIRDRSCSHTSYIGSQLLAQVNILTEKFNKMILIIGKTRWKPSRYPRLLPSSPYQENAKRSKQTHLHKLKPQTPLNTDLFITCCIFSLFDQGHTNFGNMLHQMECLLESKHRDDILLPKCFCKIHSYLFK